MRGMKTKRAKKNESESESESEREERVRKGEKEKTTRCYGQVQNECNMAHHRTFVSFPSSLSCNPALTAPFFLFHLLCALSVLSSLQWSGLFLFSFSFFILICGKKKKTKGN